VLTSAIVFLSAVAAAGLLWFHLRLRAKQRRTERRMAAVLEAVPDIIIRGRRDGTILSVSPGRETHPISRPESLLGRRVDEILPPETAGPVLRALETACETGTPQTAEYTFPDGDRVATLEARIVPNTAGGDEAIAFVRNISERKEAETAQKEQANLFRTLLDAIPAPVFYKDATGRILGCNPAFAAFHARRREELVDRIPEEILPPEEAAACRRALEETLIRPWPVLREERTKDGRGRTRTVLKSRSAFRDAEGELAGIVGVATDITEQKEVEAALRTSEMRLRDMLEATADGVWETNPQTGADHYSAGWLRILGYAPGDLPEREETWESLIHPEDRPRVLEAYGKLLDGTTATYRCEYRLRGKDGAYRWVQSRARIAGRDDAGRPVRVIGTHDDVTERHETTEMLIRAEQLAAVGTLAGGVAHEFNNLHGAILGYLELVLNREDLPEEIRRRLETVHNAARRAAGVTRNLLTFAEQRRNQKRPAELNRIIQDTLRIVEHELTSGGVALDFEPGEVPTVHVDAAQIGQVVMNLLINAAHAVTGCAERRIAIRTGVANGAAFLRIADSGCGIPETHLPKLFLPFFTTKGEHAPGESAMAGIKGTGLGLSVANTIMQAHDGRIDVESRPGEGSVFTIRLPLPTGEASATPDTAPPRAGGTEDGTARGSGRILVVEDEAMIRELMAEVLGAAGYGVEGTDDGTEALRRIEADGIDAVVVDLQMPKMDGVELLRRIHDLPLPHPPALFVVTGKITDEQIEGYADLGVLATLRKPFDWDAVLATLSTALPERRRTADTGAERSDRGVGTAS
jgi:PAS domain S-box-containing protein